jgi:hypothetical protein
MIFLRRELYLAWHLAEPGQDIGQAAHEFPRHQIEVPFHWGTVVMTDSLEVVEDTFTFTFVGIGRHSGEADEEAGSDQR